MSAPIRTRPPDMSCDCGLPAWPDLGELHVCDPKRPVRPSSIASWLASVYETVGMHQGIAESRYQSRIVERHQFATRLNLGQSLRQSVTYYAHIASDVNGSRP